MRSMAAICTDGGAPAASQTAAATFSTQPKLGSSPSSPAALQQQGAGSSALWLSAVHGLSVPFQEGASHLMFEDQEERNVP